MLQVHLLFGTLYHNDLWFRQCHCLSHIKNCPILSPPFRIVHGLVETLFSTSNFLFSRRVHALCPNIIWHALNLDFDLSVKASNSNHQGFDEFYGYNCQRLAHNYYPYHLWDNQEKIILKGNTGTQTNQYAPELIHQKALAFIEKNHQKPFFLYYPSIIPHAELTAPERWMEKYRSQFAPEQEYIGVEESSPHYKNGWYASQKHPRAAFAAMISLLDEQVGEIRRKLEELGIAKNTIILFTSDNGPHWEGGADPEFFNSSAGFRGYK